MNFKPFVPESATFEPDTASLSYDQVMNLEDISDGKIPPVGYIEFRAANCLAELGEFLCTKILATIGGIF